MSLIIFILILSFLVLIHEFGHFIAAKKSGIKVEEFAIGFPPRLFAIKRGETTYTINLLPLGGFVKLFGEEYQELDSSKLKAESSKPQVQDVSRAFAYKKPYQKALVVAAGVIMNLILGVSIYYGLIAWNGFKSDPLPLLFPHTFTFGTQEGRVIATNLVKNSPAEKAGLKPEDSITEYSTETSGAVTRLTSASQLIDVIKKSQDKVIILGTQNIKNGQIHNIRVVPQYNKTLKRAVIGVNLIDGVVISYTTPLQKVFAGFMHSYNILEYNYSTIAELFKIAHKEKNASVVSGVVSGPIGIYSVIHDMVKTSGAQVIKNLLNVMALLSLSLAVMNILPFPALDGGRMVFVVYEWITKKQVNKKIENITNIAGFAVLMLLAILVSINDMLRLIK